MIIIVKKALSNQAFNFIMLRPKGIKFGKKNNEPGSSNSNLNLISND